MIVALAKNQWQFRHTIQRNLLILPGHVHWFSYFEQGTGPTFGRQKRFLVRAPSFRFESTTLIARTGWTLASRKKCAMLEKAFGSLKEAARDPKPHETTLLPVVGKN